MPCLHNRAKPVTSSFIEDKFTKITSKFLTFGHKSSTIYVALLSSRWCSSTASKPLMTGSVNHIDEALKINVIAALDLFLGWSPVILFSPYSCHSWNGLACTGMLLNRCLRHPHKWVDQFLFSCKKMEYVCIS